MKTAKETINRIVLTGFDLPDAINLIKEYAKQVAEQALKEASENAMIECNDARRLEKSKKFYGYADDDYTIDKESITNTEIKTP